MLPELQKLKEALEKRKSEMGEEELHEVQRELLNELAFLDYIGEHPAMKDKDTIAKSLDVGPPGIVCPCCGRPY